MILRYSIKINIEFETELKRREENFFNWKVDTYEDINTLIIRLLNANDFNSLTQLDKSYSFILLTLLFTLNETIHYIIRQFIILFLSFYFTISSQLTEEWITLSVLAAE